MSKNPVVHFEVPGEDMARMQKFYQTAFGWQTNQLGPEMSNYVVVMTAESDPNDASGRPKEPGMINGGFYKKPADPAGAYPSFVIAVENLEEASKNVVAAGGTLHGKAEDIPGVGKFQSFIDTEGNRISMLQPLPMNK